MEVFTFAIASLKSTAFSMDTGRIIVSPDVITVDEVRALAILCALTPNRLAAEEILKGRQKYPIYIAQYSPYVRTSIFGMYVLSPA